MGSTGPKKDYLCGPIAEFERPSGRSTLRHNGAYEAVGETCGEMLCSGNPSVPPGPDRDQIPFSVDVDRISVDLVQQDQRDLIRSQACAGVRAGEFQKTA
jgi:hypothetical protein